MDWNCLNGDAEGKNQGVQTLIKNVKESSQGRSKLVILMHDSPGKETSVQALPHIIKYLRQQGYRFDTLE